MHILTLVHTDPKNFEAFEKWINSRDYGSRPFCREVRLFDIAIQEDHKDRLLADLKYYYKDSMIGSGKRKTKKIQKLIQFIFKFFKLKSINMDKIEKTPEKWFTPVKFGTGVTHAIYLFPIGSYPDAKDPKNKFRNDMI